MLSRSTGLDAFVHAALQTSGAVFLHTAGLCLCLEISRDGSGQLANSDAGVTLLLFLLAKCLAGVQDINQRRVGCRAF